MTGVTKFFIIGAPKCGTTSMATWLSEHANIYMSPVKEPHYYNTDSSHILTPNESEYKKLFSDVNSGHKAVGEASVFYLVSKVAVDNIERAEANARYIVMIRNPIEMAPSLHEQQVFSGNENIADFATAWKLNPERRKGLGASRYCRDPRLLDYGNMCSLGAQLSLLYKKVPSERVLTLLMDDLKSDPRREYLRVLDFLEVPDDGRMNFESENTAKARKSPFFRSMVRGLNGLKRKLRLPRLQTGILSFVDDLNRTSRPRPPLSGELKSELAEYFKEDIMRLSEILGRDLSPWLRNESVERR